MAAYAEGSIFSSTPTWDCDAGRRTQKRFPCATRVPISIRSTSAASPRYGAGARSWPAGSSI